MPRYADGVRHGDETVSFTRMEDGTREDWELLELLERPYLEALPERLLAAVRALEHSFSGYRVSRYEHSLQSATRAHRDGRDEEYVVACLLHDIGDELAPHTHGEMMGAVLRPYIRPELVWVVEKHGLFQSHYYAHHTGGDRDARERYRDHEWFEDCAEFCERYDQNCFDPAYESEPLEFFEPMLRRVISEPPRYLGDEG